MIGGLFALAAGSAAAIDVIQGDWQFNYKDLGGAAHAVRLGQVEPFDQQPDGGTTYRAIGPFGTSGPFPMIVTDLAGKASAKLENFEVGGIDPSARISTATGTGRIEVTMNFARPDDTPGAHYAAMSPTTANVSGNFSAAAFTVPDATRDTGKAFAAFDSLVTGKRYLEYLGAQSMTINGVLGTQGTSLVKQPASSDTRIFQLNVGLNNRTNYAGSIGSDAFDWDVLLHEVGHTASFANGFNSFPIPGGAHGLTAQLAPTLAWSEGYSNFFQSAAQDWENRQAGLARLPDVMLGAGSPSIRATVASYTDTVDANLKWNLEDKDSLFIDGKKVIESLGARNEMAVARILWDLLDGTDGAEFAQDEVTLGHKALFDLLVESTAKTLNEFADFLARKFPVARARAELGAIFAAHGVAPRALSAGPPPGAASAPPAASSSGPAGQDIASGGPAHTPSKDATDAPYYPDPLPDTSVPAFRLGSDPLPTFSWLAPWGSSEPTSETYRIQFFRSGATPVAPLFDLPDLSDGSDSTPQASLELLRYLDLSSTGSGDHFGNCGQDDALGFRCFEPRSDFLRELLNSASGDQRIYWGIAGQSDGSLLDTGIWGNVLALDLYAVPEPGMLGLTALMLGCVEAVRRRGRRNQAACPRVCS